MATATTWTAQGSWEKEGPAVSTKGSPVPSSFSAPNEVEVALQAQALPHIPGQARVGGVVPGCRGGEAAVCIACPGASSFHSSGSRFGLHGPGVALQCLKSGAAPCSVPIPACACVHACVFVCARTHKHAVMHTASPVRSTVGGGSSCSPSLAHLCRARQLGLPGLGKQPGTRLRQA